jgi:hypothetical protein
LLIVQDFGKSKKLSVELSFFTALKFAGVAG